MLLQWNRHTGLSNAALARSVLVTPQSMSELLGGLVGEGLVERETATRGRPVVSRLTAAGRRTLRRCEAVVAEVEASLGLSAAERATLNGLLHRVLEPGDGP